MRNNVALVAMRPSEVGGRRFVLQGEDEQSTTGTRDTQGIPGEGNGDTSERGSTEAPSTPAEDNKKNNETLREYAERQVRASWGEGGLLGPPRSPLGTGFFRDTWQVLRNPYALSHDAAAPRIPGYGGLGALRYAFMLGVLLFLVATAAPLAADVVRVGWAATSEETLRLSAVGGRVQGMEEGANGSSLVGAGTLAALVGGAALGSGIVAALGALVYGLASHVALSVLTRVPEVRLFERDAAGSIKRFRPHVLRLPAVAFRDSGPTVRACSYGLAPLLTAALPVGSLWVMSPLVAMGLAAYGISRSRKCGAGRAVLAVGTGATFILISVLTFAVAAVT